jgi:hypothetical protein
MSAKVVGTTHGICSWIASQGISDWMEFNKENSPAARITCMVKPLKYSIIVAKSQMQDRHLMHGWWNIFCGRIG